ncbi:hypothetical protein ABL78_4807 [Leptomonas seymouri]|uniref:ODAD1 central coiled coil region domain-containing protein n=1 Tax=Leptomonas seymouri TaxID=5684 RepID=A0A0N1I4C6_LEPSE|nr:hypothetical protein ABL78_4807 [Leptomonas seymouri]|eukprot:KPI86115.1 hypothetical protein ABL78_4807 [Leptomonas seymouri]
MKAAAPAARAPRPPLTPGNGSAGAPPAAGTVVATETQLRRRFAEVEMRLRDIDDDMKRMEMHHEQELAVLEKDNKRLSDRLEELRMEECMTPAEAQAMQAPGRTSPLTQGHRVESKLLGATSTKYKTAKAAVDAKRKECAQAERQLAEVHQQLAEARQRRKALKRQVFATKASAGMKIAAAQQYKVQVREQLRGLEEQVAREQERFSNMVMDAKRVRSEIDALLVKQSHNQKIYSKHYDDLLDKRKEMAYLMEVCNSLCEERQHVNAELQEMEASLAEESRQYEAAFQELMGVVEENAAVRATNLEKIHELRRLIAQTAAEREALEAQNEEAKTAMERRRRHRVGRRASSRGDESGGPDSGSERNFAHRASDNESPDIQANNGIADSSCGETSFEASSVVDEHSQQAKEFEEYFQKLANIVQSDAIEDVVDFIDVAADERYRCFDEMNALKRDIAELTTEKAALKTQLMHGGAMPAASVSAISRSASTSALGAGGAVMDDPSASHNTSLATLAMTNSVEVLATAAASSGAVRVTRRSEQPDKASSSSADDVAQAAAKRAEHMRELQGELEKTRDAFIDQEQQCEECSAVLSQVVAQVNEAFHGLGCSVMELRATTGLEGVQRGTLLQSLSVVEQRVEEFLLAYSHVQHRQQQQGEEQRALNAGGERTAASHGASHDAARTVLRRPDLPPKMNGGAAARVASHPLPRTNDVAPMVSHISVDPTSAVTLDELVEERLLSDAELRKVVEMKRSVLHR